MHPAGYCQHKGLLAPFDTVKLQNMSVPSPQKGFDFSGDNQDTFVPLFMTVHSFLHHTINLFPSLKSLQKCCIDSCVSNVLEKILIRLQIPPFVTFVAVYNFFVLVLSKRKHDMKLHSKDLPPIQAQ